MKVEELDGLCIELIALKEEVEATDNKLKETREKFRLKQTEVLAAMEKYDKTEMSGPYGKLKIQQREYYKMTDKEAALNWLKERGDFDNLVSVNANTMSSYVKQLVHAKREEGDFCWTPPGVTDSTSDYKTIKITRKF